MSAGNDLSRPARPEPGNTLSDPTHCQNGNAALEAGRARRRALLAEVERSRVEFETRWQARAELLGRRFWVFRLAHINRTEGQRYPTRPDREEGWHDPQPVTLPPGNPWPWQNGDQSHEWKATEAGSIPWKRRPFPWERQK